MEEEGRERLEGGVVWGLKGGGGDVTPPQKMYMRCSIDYFVSSCVGDGFMWLVGRTRHNETTPPLVFFLFVDNARIDNRTAI